MYVIKVKNKNQFIYHSEGIVDDINCARTFIKTSGAKRALNNYTNWSGKYMNIPKEDYEILEVEIKLK